MTVTLARLIFIADSNKFAKTASKLLSFLRIHFELHIKSHILLEFIDSTMKMFNHALEVDLIRSGYRFYCFFWDKEVFVQHFKLIGGLQ